VIILFSTLNLSSHWEKAGMRETKSP